MLFVSCRLLSWKIQNQYLKLDTLQILTFFMKTQEYSSNFVKIS